MDHISPKKYNTMILSGGAMKGISMIGGIQYLHDNHMLDIQMYISCSVGSIISYLLALGYQPSEILSQCISEKIIQKFNKINIAKLTKGLGCLDWKNIEDFLYNMTFEKCDEPLTFEDLYTKFNKKLVCSTYNLNTNKIEYLSLETTPKLLCISAIRMSCNVPFLFNRYKYKGSYYIDPGMVDNFPIEYNLNNLVEDPVIIGINSLQLNTKSIENDYEISNEIFEDGADDITEYNIKEYINDLLNILTSYHNDLMIKNNNDENFDIISLNQNESAFNFNITSQDMLNLFSNGYQLFKNKYQ